MFPRSIRRYSSRHSGDARRGWSRGFLLLLELPEHLLRHEAVARVEVVLKTLRKHAESLVEASNGITEQTGTIRVTHRLLPVAVVMAGADVVDPWKD